LRQRSVSLRVERNRSSPSKPTSRNSPKLPREQLRAAILCHTDPPHQPGAGGGRQDVPLLLQEDLGSTGKSELRAKERIGGQLLWEAQVQFVQKEADALRALPSAGRGDQSLWKIIWLKRRSSDALRKRSAFAVEPPASFLPSSSSSRCSPPFCAGLIVHMYVHLYGIPTQARANTSQNQRWIVRACNNGGVMSMHMWQLFCQRTLWALACCASPVQT